jgi:hypothetical protein
MHKKKKSGLSGKEAADDVPSWRAGTAPGDRERYGAGNYPTGPGSEFNKIKEWGDRAFE